jgi:hypothetical protein
MHVVVGGGLLAGGLLVVLLLTALFARAQGRGWLDSDFAALVLTIPPTVMMGVGAAYVLVGLFGDHRPVDLLALVGWLAIGAGLIWVMRRRREALAGAAAVAAEDRAGVAPFEPPGPPGSERSARRQPPA